MYLKSAYICMIFFFRALKNTLSEQSALRNVLIKCKFLFLKNPSTLVLPL